MSAPKNATINHRDPSRNMYGCTPCPKCRGRHRYGWQEWDGSKTTRLRVVCDNCGFKQDANDISDEEAPHGE